MADIFLSYSREDARSAEAIARRLEEQGWSVFWDRNIPAGRSFATVIESEIANASCIVVLWSRTSVQSSWVLEEASEGRRLGLLLPVQLEEVRPPLEFRSLMAANLTDWQGEIDHKGFQELVRAIRRLLPAPKQTEQRPKLDFGDVFVSYAREDRAYVEKLITFLTGTGLSVWADSRIDYGDLWWRTIVANLRSCLAMVVVMTTASEKSKWVEREILLADELQKPIFPLLLTGERFPIFVGTQYHDVTDRSMPPDAFVEKLKRITTHS